jgi:hypothetical protein
MRLPIIFNSYPLIEEALMIAHKRLSAKDLINASAFVRVNPFWAQHKYQTPMNELSATQLMQELQYYDDFVDFKSQIEFDAIDAIYINYLNNNCWMSECILQLS